jgi:hypothetical protein
MLLFWPGPKHLPSEREAREIQDSFTRPIIFDLALITLHLPAFAKGSKKSGVEGMSRKGARRRQLFFFLAMIILFCVELTKVNRKPG